MKSCCNPSRGTLGACFVRDVVRFFEPGGLPTSPCPRITRATWSRPTSTRRLSSFHVLRRAVEAPAT